LLQFPWSFRCDAQSRRRLDALLTRFEDLPVAVEVRHGSWESSDADAYWETKRVAVCGIDQPVIGESLRPFRYRSGPAGAYFRLHGRNYRDWFAADVGRDARYDYLYSTSELSPWADVIRKAAAASERVFVVLNNHFRGKAPANAFELIAILRDAKVAAPNRLRRTYPDIVARTEPSPYDLEDGPDLFAS
jgi:uncharacterized protein YecE (DUF72 family)